MAATSIYMTGEIAIATRWRRFEIFFANKSGAKPSFEKLRPRLCDIGGHLPEKEEFINH